MATLPISWSRSSIKLEKLCRLCLSKETVLKSIFDVHFGVTSLDYVITTLTGVKIDERDGLPTSVCNSCTDKASIAYDLKKLVLESQAFLQDIVKKEKSEKIDYNALQNEILKVKEEQACSFDDFDGDYAEVSLEDFNDADHIKVEIDAIGKSTATNQLQCHICLKQLESELALITHLKTCSISPDDAVIESGSYCPLCGTCYESCANLTKHMWLKHAELMGPKKRGRPKNVQTSTILNRLSGNGVCIKSVNLKKQPCAFCKKQIKNKEALKEHIASHRDTKLYTCLMCKKKYLKLSKFKVHPCFQNQNIKSEEDPSTGGVKENDQNTFLTEDTLRSVLGNVAVPQVCHLCSEVFDVAVDISSHIDSQHPEVSKRCNICTKLFSSVKSAARHRKSCVKIERKFECNSCGLKFPYEISLNKHILRHHEGESVSTNFIDPVLKLAAKKFQCDLCKKLFARKESLAVHTKLHNVTKTFECDVCHREFNRKDNMKQHRRTHEERVVKPQTSLCLYCGRSFNNSSNLIVHMRRHTGEKPYKCDFCGKGFPRSSDLQVHRRSHTGEKPCQCKVCGKAFSRSNKLTRHMRVHTGHKPYKCTYCEKAFAQSNDLTLHIRRHTGDKPYICEVCGDRFIQGTALQNHRRAHGHFPATAPQHAMLNPGLVQTSKNNANILLKLPMCGPPTMYPQSHSGLPLLQTMNDTDPK